MPFTIAHAAAALPLRRALGPLACTSALVVGSMAPDLVYFVPLGVDGRESHSAPGLLWFCVPAGIVAWALSAWLVLPFGRELAPRAISSRLGTCGSPWPRSAIAVSALLVSLLVGAATHLLWDSFTHAGGFFVTRWPLLRMHIGFTPAYAPPVCTWLQHASGVVGLALLTRRARDWQRRTPPASGRAETLLPLRIRGLALAALLLPSLVTAVLVFARAAGAADAASALRRSAGRAVFAGGTTLLAILLALALVWRFGRRASRAPHSSAGEAECP